MWQALFAPLLNFCSLDHIGDDCDGLLQLLTSYRHTEFPWASQCSMHCRSYLCSQSSYLSEMQASLSLLAQARGLLDMTLGALACCLLLVLRRPPCRYYIIRPGDTLLLFLRQVKIGPGFICGLHFKEKAIRLAAGSSHRVSEDSEAYGAEECSWSACL